MLTFYKNTREYSFVQMFHVTAFTYAFKNIQQKVLINYHIFLYRYILLSMLGTT